MIKGDAMPESKWLDGYSGQSADELFALASEYRIDSIVLAFEDAIQRTTGPDNIPDLNEAELTGVPGDQCDGPYQDSGEPIADRLFAYIRTNRGSIRLQQA